MEIDEEHDQKTVIIGAALGISALIVLVGALMLWLADSLGLDDHLVSALRLAVFGVAGLAMVVYLARAGEH